MTRLIALLLWFSVLIPAPVLAQGTQGRGALRPYFYVFAAYGLVWVLIGFWVFLIARRLGRLERNLQGRNPSTPGS
ncbi:MAG: CcmD family protein [Longimicrobiales bacterium]